MYRTYQVTASGPDAHHDVLLSNIAVKAFDDGTTDQMIADQLFPAVPVGKQSDRYMIVDKNAFLKDPGLDALRAPRTEARRLEFKVSSDGYYASNYALASEIALEDLANADNVFQLRENHTKLIIGVLRRAQEIRIANILTTAANFGSGTTLSGATQWDDYVNSDPLGCINTAQAFIRHQTGLLPNTVAIDYDTTMILRRHPDLLDMYKYTSGGELTNDQLKSVLKVDRVFVGRGIRQNALEGGVSSITDIWGRNCVFMVIGPATGLETMTFGLRFQWRPDGFPAPFVAGTAQEAGPGKRNVEIIEAGHFQAEKVIAPDLGYLIGSTISS